MHNQYISGTDLDVPTTSRVEKLFFNLPESYRINTQRNQRCCELSKDVLFIELPLSSSARESLQS